MGICQYECMISAASPPPNVGCERCLLLPNAAGRVNKDLEGWHSIMLHSKPVTICFIIHLIWQGWWIHRHKTLGFSSCHDVDFDIIMVTEHARNIVALLWRPIAVWQSLIMLPADIGDHIMLLDNAPVRHYILLPEYWILLPEWENSVIITRQSTNQKRVFPSDG